MENLKEHVSVAVFPLADDGKQSRLDFEGIMVCFFFGVEPLLLDGAFLN